MTNINLLPPEIAEKRKLELRRLYVFMAAGATVGIIVLIYLGVGLQISRANNELQSLKQKSARLSDAKVQLQQFADRKTELQKKQKIATQVVDKEIEWAKLLNEISMVAPVECWLSLLRASEADGLTFETYALDQTQTASSATESKETTSTEMQGHKPVAKWLVRLSLIKELKDVWLTESNESSYQDQPAVKFMTTAGWREPHATSASAAPAPPAASPPANQPSGGG